MDYINEYMINTGNVMYLQACWFKISIGISKGTFYCSNSGEQTRKPWIKQLSFLHHESYKYNNII